MAKKQSINPCGSDKDKRFFTTKEAADYLCTTPQVLANARSTGTLFGQPAPVFVQFGTRKILYAREDVDAWIKALKRSRVSGC